MQCRGSALLGPCRHARQSFSPFQAEPAARIVRAAWPGGRPGLLGAVAAAAAAARPRVGGGARRPLRCTARLASSRDSIDEELADAGSPQQTAGTTNGRTPTAALEQQAASERRAPPAPSQPRQQQPQQQQQQQPGGSEPGNGSGPPGSGGGAGQLSVRELQALTELHVEDSYAVGVVGSAQELADRLGTDLRDGLSEAPVRCRCRAAAVACRALPPPPPPPLGLLLWHAADARPPRRAPAVGHTLPPPRACYALLPPAAGPWCRCCGERCRAGAAGGTRGALLLPTAGLRLCCCAVPPAAASLGAAAQEQLAARAAQYGANAVRPPKEVTFLQLVAEALQARPLACLRAGGVGADGRVPPPLMPRLLHGCA